MRKNGHDRMGRQRWQCDGCRLTAGTRNNTKRRRTQLAEFLDGLLGAAPQRKRPESARNFRKRVDWGRAAAQTPGERAQLPQTRGLVLAARAAHRT